MKLEFSRQIFEKSSNIKFYKNPPVEAEISYADGQTWWIQWSLSAVFQAHVKMWRYFLNLRKSSLEVLHDYSSTPITSTCRMSVKLFVFGWTNNRTTVNIWGAINHHCVHRIFLRTHPRDANARARLERYSVIWLKWANNVYRYCFTCLNFVLVIDC